MAVETRHLFGEPIDSLSMDDVLSAVSVSIKTATPISISFLNAGKLLSMEKDDELRQAVENSTLRLADGQSVVTALNLLDRSVPERVAGIDLMMELLGKGCEEHYSFYFLGATDEVFKEAIAKAKKLYPDIEIVGSRNGYFKKDEETKIVEEIKNSSADILFVGIASPLKETFVDRHFKSLGVSVAMGVGGSFDVLSGKTKRAPELWQSFGLEWLYRVKQEPSRMWKRYLFGNLCFLWKLFLALVGIEKSGEDKTLHTGKTISSKFVVTTCFIFLFVKSLLFALALPPWMGNDEPNHFAYLLTVAGYGDEKTVERKIVKSLNQRGFWKLAEMKTPDPSADLFNETDLKNHSENISKSRSPLYYYLASIPLRMHRFESVESSLLMSRMVSALLSMVSLWFIYMSAKTIFAESGSKLLPITTLLFAGLHPQFSHITTVVNSDQLLIFLFSLFFYLFVRFISEGSVSTRGIIFLLVISSIASLTKQHGVMLFPLLYVGLYFVFRDSPVGFFRSVSMLTVLLFFSFLLIEYLAPLPIIKLADRVSLYAGYFLSSPSEMISLFPFGIIKGLGITFVTFCFTYGQMVHKMSYGLYTLYFLLTCLSILGLFKGLADKKFKKEKSFILFSIVFVSLLFFMLFLVFFTPEEIARISGRYLFYAIAPISVLAVFGLKSFRANSELPLIAFLLVMNFVSLFGYLLPIYY